MEADKNQALIWSIASLKAKIRNTELFFDVTGMQLVPNEDHPEERPVLFLLHGGPGGDHLRFKQHSLELEKVAQLVFIDHRGCGQSKKTHKNEYTLERLCCINKIENKFPFSAMSYVA